MTHQPRVRQVIVGQLSYDPTLECWVIESATSYYPTDDAEIYEQSEEDEIENARRYYETQWRYGFRDEV